MICKHLNKKIENNFNERIIYRCDDCLLRYVISRGINTHEYEDYYDEETGGRFNLIAEIIVKIFRFWRAFKIKFLYPKAKSILDVGSGRGYMLFFLKKYFNFKNAVGTQISYPAYKFSKEKLELEIYNNDLLEIKLDQKFDIITICHVLEHLKNPEEYVKKFYELLNNNGKLTIEVPNYNSWTRKITGKYWLSYDFENHLYFFTHTSLAGLLKKYDLKIKKINSFSLEYSTFTSVQSIISWLTKTDHLVFSFLQRKERLNSKILLHLLLFLLLFPSCLLINILLSFTKRGEIVYITAYKRYEHKKI